MTNAALVILTAVALAVSMVWAAFALTVGAIGWAVDSAARLGATPDLRPRRRARGR